MPNFGRNGPNPGDSTPGNIVYVYRRDTVEDEFDPNTGVPAIIVTTDWGDPATCTITIFNSTGDVVERVDSVTYADTTGTLFWFEINQFPE